MGGGEGGGLKIAFWEISQVTYVSNLNPSYIELELRLGFDKSKVQSKLELSLAQFSPSLASPSFYKFV